MVCITRQQSLLREHWTQAGEQPRRLAVSLGVSEPQAAGSSVRPCFPGKVLCYPNLITLQMFPNECSANERAHQLGLLGTLPLDWRD